jgi:hypothetical protein
MCHNDDMKDPRIVIPRGVRNTGFLIGFLMIAAGLIIGWIRSGHDVQLPPTGWKGGRS